MINIFIGSYRGAWVIIIKIFNVINSISVQALAAPFWFHIFFITAFFQVLAATFLQLEFFH